MPITERDIINAQSKMICELEKFFWTLYNNAEKIVKFESSAPARRIGMEQEIQKLEQRKKEAEEAEKSESQKEEIEKLNKEIKKYKGYFEDYQKGELTCQKKSAEYKEALNILGLGDYFYANTKTLQGKIINKKTEMMKKVEGLIAEKTKDWVAEDMDDSKLYAETEKVIDEIRKELFASFTFKLFNEPPLSIPPQLKKRL